MGVHISSGFFVRPDLLYYIGYCTLRHCSYDNHGEHKQQSGEGKLLFNMCDVFYLRGERERERERGHGEELIKKVEIRSENQECVVCPKQTETDHLEYMAYKINAGARPVYCGFCAPNDSMIERHPFCICYYFFRFETVARFAGALRFCPTSSSSSS